MSSPRRECTRNIIESICQVELAFTSILVRRGLPRTLIFIVRNLEALGSWQIKSGVSKHMILIQLFWKHRPVEVQGGHMAQYVTVLATMPDDLSLIPGPTR